ncbi:MAG: deoxyguanosinetriphosphate triphosphohydrolase [Alphaproteobacteria bacterium]|nr:deoxyguanosinetriphosphate triphosphohydrolase [Alphaproteobacteria bacterium]OJV14245.1 MAG: hypothetical protein BGO27_01950 [Alphaproteobacteria bacterium 33-17]
MTNFEHLKCDYTKSKGRLYQENVSSDFRTPFQRDRDRILHSKPFRRLKHKTQVFINGVGDHYRTRLTHTIEVAQVARSISRALALDFDLAEALALAHDMGHPPFGHAGENVLNAKMEGFGGFDHNAQAIKILTQLEESYAEFPGLNLSWESIEGIAKHNGPLLGKHAKKDKPIHEYLVEYNKKHDLELNKFSSLEAQIAAVSDDIAYNAHDIEDGVRAGLISFEEVVELELIKPAFNNISSKYKDLKIEILMAETIRCVLKDMIYDVIASTTRNIEIIGVESSEDIRNADKLVADFSSDMTNKINGLRTFLREKVYKHHKVNRMTKKAELVIGHLFDYFMESPNCLPNYWSSFITGDSEKEKAVVICDYIAGMTDSFAIKEHSLLFNLEKQNL